jgi:hypothetical protein
MCGTGEATYFSFSALQGHGHGKQSAHVPLLKRHAGAYLCPVSLSRGKRSWRIQRRR